MKETNRKKENINKTNDPKKTKKKEHVKKKAVKQEKPKETHIQKENNDKKEHNENRSRQNNKSEKRRISEKQRKKIEKRTKLILVLIVLIIITIAIAVLITISPLFKIQEIIVEGNSQLTKEQIIELSNIKIGDNIFFTRMQANKIENNEYIKSAQMHRKMPNKITIKVEERYKAYMLEAGEQYVYIDTQGYILETTRINLNKTILKNYKTKNISDAQRLENEDLEKLEDVLKIIKSLEEIEIKDEITYIDIKDKDNYIIYFKEANKLIYIGNEKNLANKMLYVKGIMEDTKDLEGKIYVNGDFSKGFQPYFRQEVNNV